MEKPQNRLTFPILLGLASVHVRKEMCLSFIFLLVHFLRVDIEAIKHAQV